MKQWGANMSKKIILFLVLVLMGLSAKADYTITTQQPFYNPQAAAYYNAQQPYNQTYNPQYNQGYTQNPYQYQQQCYNPYMYQRPYVGYDNNLPNIVTNTLDSTTNTTSVPRQIARDLGQSVLLRMLRGY